MIQGQVHIVQVEIAPRNVIFGACLLAMERAGCVCECESEINVILQNFFLMRWEFCFVYV